MINERRETINDRCCAGAVPANAYNVALLNGGMGDGSQLLQVDQSAVMYNNLVPLGQLLCWWDVRPYSINQSIGQVSSLTCIAVVSECCCAHCGLLASRLSRA